MARPEIAGGDEELHNGEIVFVEWPNFGHAELQHQIQSVVQRAVGDAAIVRIGMPFRARSEHELRRADVAVIGVARLEGLQGDDFFPGSPDIVIEVEAPSNTAREFREKEDLCLATGAAAFWVVYPDLREVTVAYVERGRAYRDGDEIELRGFGDIRVAVSDLLGPRRER